MRLGRRAGSWRSAILLVICVLPAALAVVLGAAAPAAAHASLLTSDPAQGQVLSSAPNAVRFAFTEAVAAVPAGIRIFDSEGDSVESSASASGPDLTVTPSQPLGNGTYVVAWRVISADGHPVSGSLSFSVGAPSKTVAPPPATDAEADVPLLLAVTRGAGYVALFLATGLVASALLLFPTHSAARAQLKPMTRIAGSAAAVIWVLQVPMTTAYLGGGGLRTLAGGGSWSVLPAREYAVSAVVVGGVLIAVALSAASSSRARTAAVVAAGVAVAAPAFTGHTRSESPAAVLIGTDVLHLIAGSTWLGGLVALGLSLRALAQHDDEAARVLARFSTVAAGVLGALAVTGSLLAWRVLGSWGGLVGTAYGRLLLLKLAIVLVVVGIAAWNRYRLLPRVRVATRRRERRKAVQSVARAMKVEAAVLVVVLAVTGFLVDRSPEAEAIDAQRAASSVRTAMLNGVEVTVQVTPLLTGTNTVTLEMTDPLDEPFEGFDAPEAQVSTGGAVVGAVELTNTGPGRYTGPVLVPSAGILEVRLSLRTTEFEKPVATLQFDISR